MYFRFLWSGATPWSHLRCLSLLGELWFPFAVCINLRGEMSVMKWNVVQASYVQSRFIHTRYNETASSSKNTKNTNNHQNPASNSKSTRKHNFTFIRPLSKLHWSPILQNIQKKLQIPMDRQHAWWWLKRWVYLAQLGSSCPTSASCKDGVRLIHVCEVGVTDVKWQWWWFDRKINQIFTKILIQVLKNRASCAP